MDIALELGEHIAETDDLVDPALVEQVVLATCDRIGIGGQQLAVTIVLTDDNELRELNREYRGIDKATDVLSFPLLNRPLVAAPPEQLWPEAATPAFPFVLPPDAPKALGDIVISLPFARRQAAEAGHTARWELAYLTAHGMLHLAGYDDHTLAGYEAMVALQEEVLQRLAPLC